MALDEPTAEAVGYLLQLADASLAERVGTRLALGAARGVVREPGGDWDPGVRRQVRLAPASVRYWLLQADNPAVNRLLFGLELLPPGLNHDVVAGVSFAPGSPDLGRSGVLEDRPVFGPEDVRRGRQTELPDIVDELRGATAFANPLRRCRSAAAEIRSAHWPELTAAHRADPLPGYARWALAERIDCPAELRASFGSHPKFTWRLNKAGIIAEPGDLVTVVEPARDALSLLGFVAQVNHGAVAAGTDALRPLVAAELGGHVEAWAVLAQLLPEFVGTAAELLALAGAIAGPDPAQQDPFTPDPHAPIPHTPDPHTPDPHAPDPHTPDPHAPAAGRP